MITSDFHMPRTRHAFEWVWGLEGPSPWPAPSQLAFQTASDEGLDSVMLAARREREAASLANQRQLAARIRTVRDVHAFLNIEHKCYAVARQAEWDEISPETSMSDKALASY